MPDITVPSAFRFLYQGKARYRAAYGGRGSAKSHSFAQALVIKARQAPLRILCAREIQKSIKDSVKRLIDDKIEACGLSSFFESLDTEIRGQNGSIFLFAGLRTNPDSIKSMEGLGIAWIEEASTVSQRSLDLLTPTLRLPDSEIWATWNPRFPTDPIDAMFRGGSPPPNTLVKQVSCEDNPWFPDVLRTDMEWDRGRDPEKYAHVWLGEYLRNSEARVFRNWRVESFETPDNARFYYGADWGFSVDPTVLVRCWIDDRTLYVDKEVYQVGCEIDRTPALFDKMPGSRLWPIRADSASPQTISYMQRHGFPKIVQATKGPNSVEEGVNFLKSYDIVVHPECKHTIDELTLYSYEVDKLTDEVLPILQDKSNHCIDALRYAVELVRCAVHAPKIVVPIVVGHPRHNPFA
jgi:phage terminase large subunit